MDRAENKYVPDYTVLPGEVLEEYLDSSGMTQVMLAKRLGLTKKTINHIIKGKAPITPDTSLGLERVFGRPAHFWNNLEQQYQEDCARLADLERLQENLDWLKNVPVNKMVEYGYIQKFKNKAEQLAEVLQFYGVASQRDWRNVWESYNVAYRQSQSFKPCDEAVSAWLRQGELEAQRIDCADFETKGFKEALLKIRAFTLESPSYFLPQLNELCATVGVAVVFVRELPQTGVSGATRWLNNKAVILLSLRYKTNDHLWFTFFHEAGHILKHGRKDTFLEGNGMDGEKEEEANKFARDTLIPPEKYQQFTQSSRITLGDIKAFSQEIGIAPGIVVGRLQHDKLLDIKHGNKLKVRYTWAT